MEETQFSTGFARHSPFKKPDDKDVFLARDNEKAKKKDLKE